MPRKSDWYGWGMRVLEINVKVMLFAAVLFVVVFLVASWQGGETKNGLMLLGLAGCFVSCVLCVASGYAFDAINRRLPKVLREEKKEDEKNVKRKKRTTEVHKN